MCASLCRLLPSLDDATNSMDTMKKSWKKKKQKKEKKKQMMMKRRSRGMLRRRRLGCWWRRRTRAAGKRKIILEEEVRRSQKGRQRLGETRLDSTSSRKALAEKTGRRATEEEEEGRCSAPKWSPNSRDTTKVPPSTTSAPNSAAIKGKTGPAGGAARERQRPRNDPMGPTNSSRNLGGKQQRAGCAGGGSPPAQVHRRTPTRTAAALDGITLAALGPTQPAIERNARTQAIGSSLTPKVGYIFNAVDRRRPEKRAYSLIKQQQQQEKIITSEIRRGKQIGSQFSQPNLGAARGHREAGAADAAGSDGNGEPNIKCRPGGSYLTTHIKRLDHLHHCQRSSSAAALSLSSWTGAHKQDRHNEADFDKQRSPVQRLKSMPPSNQRATQTNNRSSPRVRRTVVCAGPGVAVCSGAGGEGGVLVNVPRVARQEANLVRTAPRSAWNSMFTGRQPSGHYLTRQRLAADLAQMAHWPGLAQASLMAAGNQEARFNQQQQQQQQQQQEHFNEIEQLKSKSRAHQWHWSETEKSHECVISEDRLSLCFHPHCSESAAACRAAEPLKRNGNYYYWEIHVQDKIYGTSVMFGLCTRRQRMHTNAYCNLIGLDDCGWSLSHKGLAWHNGLAVQYTDVFPVNRPVTIGLLYNTMCGELSYFMDGKNLGVAFRGLNDIQEELYPVVASTAKCTQMTLVGSYCGYVSLLERSCFTLLKSVVTENRHEFIEYLRKQNIPKHLLQYVAHAANVNKASLEQEAAAANTQTRRATTGTKYRPDWYVCRRRAESSRGIQQ